jgi:hypothetical protein
VVDFDAVELDDAAQDVHMQEGAEVADVAVVVDGGAAAIEAQAETVGGVERLDLSGEGVEEFEGQGYGFFPEDGSLFIVDGAALSSLSSMRRRW